MEKLTTIEIKKAVELINELLEKHNNDKALHLTAEKFKIGSERLRNTIVKFGYRYNRRHKKYIKGTFIINDKNVREVIDCLNEFVVFNTRQDYNQIIVSVCEKLIMSRDYLLKEIKERGIVKDRAGYFYLSEKKVKKTEEKEKIKEIQRVYSNKSEDWIIKKYKMNKTDKFLYFSDEHEEIYNFIKKMAGNIKKCQIYPAPNEKQYAIIQDLKTMELINFEVKQRNYLKPETFLKIEVLY